MKKRNGQKQKTKSIVCTVEGLMEETPKNFGKLESDDDHEVLSDACG